MGSRMEKAPLKKNEVYTEPELRKRIKNKIMRGAKGGRPGQWSARKAQLVASEYRKEGGDYVNDRHSVQAEHLRNWTSEQWTTSDGRLARRGKLTARYLPSSAWSKLSSGQKRATNRKKTVGSRRGKQFVDNTKAARDARLASSRRGK